MFNLCIERMNGSILDAEYNAKKIEYFDKAIDLIKAELPIMEMGKIVESFYTNAKAGGTNADLEKVIIALKTDPMLSTTTTTTTTISAPPSTES